MSTYIAFDNAKMHEDAKRARDTLAAIYVSLRKTEEKGLPTDNLSKTVNWLWKCAYEVHPDLREKYNINSLLSEVIERGYVTPSEEQLSPYDSATKKAYWDSLREEFRQNMTKALRSKNNS